MSRATMCLGRGQGFAAMSTKQLESARVIDLDGQTPFASGDNRLCFRHPNDPSRCIKVLREGRACNLQASSPFYKRVMREAYFDDNGREYRAYQQPAIVRSKTPYHGHIARCFGWVKTTQGEGLCHRLCRQSTGMPAQTLETYVGSNGLDEPARRAVNEFCEFLRESRLCSPKILCLTTWSLLRTAGILGSSRLTAWVCQRCCPWPNILAILRGAMSRNVFSGSTFACSGKSVIDRFLGAIRRSVFDFGASHPHTS